MGKEKGWISLSRSIVDNWVWDNGEQFSRGQAWIDLLLSANHEDRKIMFDGKPLLVKRGSFVTSQHKLADKWHWSRHKVSLFLKALPFCGTPLGSRPLEDEPPANHHYCTQLRQISSPYKWQRNQRRTSSEPLQNH